MKPLVLSTDGRRGAAAGLSMIQSGGNAADAVAAALLAWPRTLMSAGAIVAVGTGLGRVACRFPAWVPGFGLSRPRRLRIIESAEPTSKSAAPSAAPALAAFLSRYGTASLPAVCRAAAGEGAAEAPHAAALEALAAGGSDGFVRGPFGSEAARLMGPLAGGLVTRRDLIEAKGALGVAQELGNGLFAVARLTRAGRREVVTGRHLLAVVAIDRRGAIAAASADAGPRVETPMPRVLGVPVNALLADQPASQMKKVGRELAVAVSVVVGGEEERLAVAGPAAIVREILDGADPPAEERGVVRLRLAPGGGLTVEGEAHVERP